jgi:hypothetical protein
MLVAEYNIVYNNYKVRDRSTDPVTEFTFFSEDEQAQFIDMYTRNKIATRYAYNQTSGYGEVYYG